MSDTTPVKVGLIGCGNISGQYFEFAKKTDKFDVVAVADLNREAAQAKADEHGVPRVLGVDELIDDAEVEVVLNLTIPQAHVPLMLRSLEAGKSTYCEKPLGTDRDEAKVLVDAAGRSDLLVGCAPDTVLGAGIQTARAAIEDGRIGDVTAFTAVMAGGGHESWHPSPEFYYKKGGGPMLDMGPYYLTALLHLLGPIRRVAAFADITRPQRTITSEPKNGQVIDVETYDHYAGILELASGVTGTMVQSFAVPFHDFNGNHPVTIHGTRGVLLVPDPNSFDGKVCLKTDQNGTFEELPPVTAEGYGRGVGLADLCDALRAGRRTFRSDVRVSYAVLDAMLGFNESGETGRAYDLTAEPITPEAMPRGGSFDQY